MFVLAGWRSLRNLRSGVDNERVAAGVWRGTQQALLEKRALVDVGRLRTFEDVGYSRYQKILVLRILNQPAQLRRKRPYRYEIGKHFGDECDAVHAVVAGKRSV